MEMDAGEPIVAPPMPVLDLYCDRVASAVGRLSVRAFGDASPAADRVAFLLGRALQLTNILRDVGEDLDHDRIYLPEEDLEHFGLDERDLRARRVDDRFRALMDFEISRARALYDRGLGLIPLLTSRRGQAAFTFAVEAYSGILGKIRAADYDVFHGRAHLTLPEKLALLPSSVWHAWTARAA
jgi:phytoene synthase